MPMLRLTVIVVSYNVAALLRNCLHSIAASTAQSADWLSVDVLVVDNASPDNSAAMVAMEFPGVRLIASDQNLGFTGGNNLALHALGFSDQDADISQSPIPNPQSPPPDFILLLNPDTVVEADALGQMAAFLRDNPTVGVVGAHLAYGDGSFQHGAFQFPGLTQVALDLLPLADLPGIRRLLPALLNGPLNGRYPSPLWQGTAAFPVDFVLGAALMARGSAIRQVGVLDDGYFMYCEEMDWCLRLRDAGWPTFALPTARITHLEAQSSRQVRWATFERLWRSRFRFYEKYSGNYPPGYRIALSILIRYSMYWRIWRIVQKFKKGMIDGRQFSEISTAYRKVIELL